MERLNKNDQVLIFMEIIDAKINAKYGRKLVGIVINWGKILICALPPKFARNQTILYVGIITHSFLADCLISAHSYAFLFIVIAILSDGLQSVESV
jgi:hypothetical protein